MSDPPDLPLEPLSDHHGSDRGTPLDRWYIERFLTEHREVIRGSEYEDPRFPLTAAVYATKP